MQTTFWTALLTSLAAAAVTSLGIWTIRRFADWGHRNTAEQAMRPHRGLGTGLQGERGAVHAADFIGDGQPQASALARRSRHPVKALHDTATLALRHTRAIVLYLQVYPGWAQGALAHAAAHGHHAA